MNKMRINHRRLFRVTLFFLCLFAGNLALFPTAAMRRLEGNSFLLVVCGALFWVTAALSVVFFIWTERLRRKLDNTAWKESGGRRRPGLLCFFQNRAAAVADVLLLLFAAVFLFGRLFQKTSAVLFPTIAALLMLIFLHAMLNGRNYRFLCRIQHTGKSKTEKSNA